MMVFDLSRRAWVCVVLGWSGWALLTTAETVTRSIWLGLSADVGRTLSYRVPIAAVYAIATPAIFAMSRAIPLAGRRVGRWLAHLLASFVLVMVIDAASCAIALFAEGVPFDLGAPSEYLSRVVGIWMVPVGMLYWLLVAIDHCLRHLISAREKERNAAELETQLARVRLAALQSQLHPHFLFNALHSIGALVRTGRNADAVKVTGGLGELLRRLLDERVDGETTLEKELELVRHYLDIERIRFSDRLTVRYDVPGSLLGVMVPHLVLQPLVENALRHGLQHSATGGTVEIAAQRAGPALVLSVRDDGAGLEGVASATRRSGIGLANTRVRLATIYGNAGQLQLAPRPGGGTEARITIPLRWRYAGQRAS